jgi:hypothetical protein
LQSYVGSIKRRKKRSEKIQETVDVWRTPLRPHAV